ncbi:hypothetical protein KIL84_002411 [Mauremys mutica]|uniref:Uncharacterized protein n=1 Tax=Mauremys mutica TaxID=74926 RepID=A0A9D4AS96_9SAUR|nr:hypothetical protein KIL84_002411 [Mauremys mutica]
MCDLGTERPQPGLHAAGAIRCNEGISAPACPRRTLWLVPRGLEKQNWWPGYLLRVWPSLQAQRLQKPALPYPQAQHPGHLDTNSWGQGLFLALQNQPGTGWTLLLLGHQQNSSPRAIPELPTSNTQRLQRGATRPANPFLVVLVHATEKGQQGAQPRGAGSAGSYVSSGPLCGGGLSHAGWSQPLPRGAPKLETLQTRLGGAQAEPKVTPLICGI